MNLSVKSAKLKLILLKLGKRFIVLVKSVKEKYTWILLFTKERLFHKKINIFPLKI